MIEAARHPTRNPELRRSCLFESATAGEGISVEVCAQGKPPVEKEETTNDELVVRPGSRNLVWIKKA